MKPHPSSVASARIEAASTPPRSISSIAVSMMRLRVSCMRRTYTVRRTPAPRHPAGMQRWAEPARKDYSMDDKDILHHIDDLIKTEHELRARLAAGSVATQREQGQEGATEG